MTTTVKKSSEITEEKVRIHSHAKEKHAKRKRRQRTDRVAGNLSETSSDGTIER